MSKGIRLITAERVRQIAKGYTPEFDTKYQHGELVEAATHLLAECSTNNPIARYIRGNHNSDRLKILTVAGALIAAEIDRRQSGKWQVFAHNDVQQIMYQANNEAEARRIAVTAINSGEFNSVSIHIDEDNDESSDIKEYVPQQQRSTGRN